jgi:arginine exporter protein ArgO
VKVVFPSTWEGYIFLCVFCLTAYNSTGTTYRKGKMRERNKRKMEKNTICCWAVTVISKITNKFITP